MTELTPDQLGWVERFLAPGKAAVTCIDPGGARLLGIAVDYTQPGGERIRHAVAIPGWEAAGDAEQEELLRKAVALLRLRMED